MIVTLFAHLRHGGQVALAAAGALDAPTEALVLAHLRDCARCRREHDATKALLATLAAEPLATAAPPCEIGDLTAAVHARLDARALLQPEPLRPRYWPWLAVPALAAALYLMTLQPASDGSGGPGDRSPAGASVAPESLDRLERNLAREQTARYLGEAQDLLVTVAATPPHCRRGQQQLDVRSEAQQSRELLKRRALYAELLDEHAPSAEPVLNDVERVLREVAELDDCAHPETLVAIQRELDERRVLMKLSLVQRELLG